jgi:outer membrane pore protein F
MMYGETRNMTVEKDSQFANKTQNFEAVIQYQFDFGLRPLSVTSTLRAMT